MKIYSQTDYLGFYIGTQANEGVAGAIDTPSPEFNRTTHHARWVGDAWDIRANEEWDAVLNPPAIETQPDPRALRSAAYRLESDPLKIEAEYDALITCTGPDYSLWVAKVAEIKNRYPLEHE